MLKNRADLKSLVYVALITGIWVWNWSLPHFQWTPFLLACLGGVCVSSMVHNHVHVPMFKSKILNGVYDYWLTIIYGYPVFAWISTHNKNHHVFNNRTGDFAPSYISSEKNNLFTLLYYPTVSGSVQQKVNFDYLKLLWKTNRPKCVYYLSQYAAVLTVMIGSLIINWKKGLLYVIIPQQIALNVVLIFNYLQHIHADEESKFNHSRNYESPVMNTLLFNNGFHTIHHMKPLAHWSELPALHAKIADRIDPRLKEKSFGWMIIRSYLLAPIFPKFGTFDMRAERLERERLAGAGLNRAKISDTQSVSDEEILAAHGISATR